MLRHIVTFKTLKRNFSLSDSIKVFRAINKESERINLSKNKTLYLRKGTKDYETLNEIFIDNIYNLPLHVQPKTIIDAGANIGLASRFFKMKYPNASVVLIEIDQDNLNMIGKNLAPYNDLHIMDKALYNKKAYFKVEDPFNATNSFVVTEVSKEDKYDIEAITIPEILEKHQWNTIDILKIDIEGAEKQLFSSNYDSWLPKVNVIMIETHDRMVPQCSITVMKALDEFGFGLYTTTNGGTLIFYNKTLLNN